MAITHKSDVYFFILILFGLAALVFIPDLLSAASTEWSQLVGDQDKWLTQFSSQKSNKEAFLLKISKNINSNLETV